MAGIDKTGVTRRFARSCDSYTRAAAVQRNMAELLLEQLTLAVVEREFDTVTELGCGSGLLTDLIEARLDYGALHLIDIVPEWEVFHRNRAGADFTVGDIEIMDLPTADLVLSNAVLQWANDLPRLLARIAGGLNSGGIFGFSTFGPENLSEIAALTGRKLAYRSGAELLKLLEPHFDVLAFHEEHHTLRFETPLAALRHLKATGVTALGSARRWTKGTLAGFERDYREKFQCADGRLPLTYHPILLIARKKSSK